MHSKQAKWLIAASMTALLAGCGSDSPEKKAAPEDAQPIPEPLRLFENGPFPVAGLSETSPITPGRYLYTPRGSAIENTGLVLISGSGRMVLGTGAGTYFARIETSESGEFENLITMAGSDGGARNLTGTQNPNNANQINVGVVDQSNGETIESGAMTLQAPNDATNPDSLPAEYESVTTTNNDQENIWKLSITAEGSFSGSDQTLCQISGAYEPAPKTTHIYEVEFEATKCLALGDLGAADRNGTYKGLILHYQDSIELYATNGPNVIEITAIDTESPLADENFRSAFTTDDYEINESVVSTIDAGLYSYQEIATDPDATPDDLETGIAIISPTGRIVIQTEENFQIRTRIDGFDTRGTLDDQIDNLADGANLRITGVVNSEPGAPMKLLGNIESEGQFAARFELTEVEPANGVSPVTLADLSGTYSDVDPLGQFTTTITIASDGTLTGGDEACIFNGSVTTLDSVTTPVFEARFSAEQCAARPDVLAQDRNGTFNLIGVLSDDGTGTKTVQALFASSFYLSEFNGTN